MLNASSYVVVHPSFEEPELLVQFSQASGFIDTLAGGALRVRLPEDALYAYMRQVNVRTKMASGQSSYNELPGVDISLNQISTASYLLQVRSEYNHHDVRAGGVWGLNLVDAYRQGMRQANFQLCRDATLFGMNPQLGEGLVNAPGALETNLPPDTNGNDTVLTYDNGQMAFYLAQEILDIKNRTLQLGIGKKFTIIGPQRTLGQFQYNVVQLVQFQREGAGTSSTAGTLKKILEDNEDTIVWAYDDTLQGAGSDGADIVLLVMPEVTKPASPSTINTNAFASVSPGTDVCTTQYADMAAPREIVSPLAGGATDFLMEWRITSGWPVRGTAVTIVNMQYS